MIPEDFRPYTKFASAPLGPIKQTSVEDIVKALDRVRGLPPPKWLLVSPDGKVWAETDPNKLIPVIALRGC